MTMTNMHYRTISWWMTWEDLDFPNTSIERKIRARAKAAHEAGVEMVILFGFHFRWDFVCCFETVNALIRFITDCCHEYGIKVLDHHSCTLAHRPRDWNGRVDTFIRNHHHVPFTPDREVYEYLQYNGTRLASWRERRVDDGTPVFLTAYQCELYCTNNPDFVAAYCSYVARLFRETGIDGVMSDDIGRYAHWAACGCDHCRSSFRQLTGKTLPPAHDQSFWGNYDNPDFRAWVDFREQVPVNFLHAVRNAIPRDALLTSCCSGSVSKIHDACVIDIALWARELNTLMLEMCGSLTDDNGMAARAADVLLEHQLGRSHGKGVLGLGYAYYPDEAFLVWSFDRFLNNDIWISSHKTRLGIGYDEQKLLPDEPEMVKEAFLYEKAHQELFEVEDITRVGLYLNTASRSFNGDAAEDYSAGIIRLAKDTYNASLPFTMQAEVPAPDEIPFLVVADAGCLSDAELVELDEYRKNGGTLILTGPCGLRDQLGNDRADTPLAKYGITQRFPKLDRSNPDFDKFFLFWGWDIHRDIPAAIEYDGDAGAPDSHGFFHLGERLLWTPARMHVDANRKTLVDALRDMLPPLPVQASLPADVLHRLYRAKDGGFILHCMPTNMQYTYHETLRFQGRGKPIVKSVTYPGLHGTLALQGDFREATLFSPDLDAPRPLQNGTVSLDGLRRFFTVRIQ